MDGREIIIADRDARYRSQMADYFLKVGYRVRTAESAGQVLAFVLEGQAAVLLLENGFCAKLASCDLIHLLKQCDRRLHVIMVCDAMSLAQARQVRQEGIFYHALKPAHALDTEELGQVVSCVFEQMPSGPRSETAASQAQQARVLATESSPVRVASGKAWAGMVALILLLGACAYYLVAEAGEKVHNGSNLTMLIFLGFCAMVLVGQLLPIFRIKLARGRMAQTHATQEITPRGGK